MTPSSFICVFKLKINFEIEIGTLDGPARALDDEIEGFYYYFYEEKYLYKCIIMK